MIEGLVSRLLAAPDSPTADLYFLNACGDFLDRGVTRAGPTVFDAPAARLIMRHDLRSRPSSAPGRGVIYFLDDLVTEGGGDRSLPLRYRQKLRLVERRARGRYANAAERIVTSSRMIAHSFAPGADLIDPYWSEPIADQRHFDAVKRGTGWIEIAFLGSSVHRGGLAFLAPIIRSVLAAEPRARFHLAERHHLPAGLHGHPRVLPIPGRGWTAYRAGLAARRFHIALYPLLDTSFNMARSQNKLIEHAVVGAAPLYSRCWTPAEQAAAADAGVVLENDPRLWCEALTALLGNFARARDLAAGAGVLARRLNDPGRQRALWSRLLQLHIDAAA